MMIILAPQKTIRAILNYVIGVGFGLGVSTTEVVSQAYDREGIYNEPQRRLELADSTLNLTYQSLLRSLDQHEQRILIIAQRKWLEFRDAECKYPRGWRSEYNCLITRTEERTAQLRRWKEVN